MLSHGGKMAGKSRSQYTLPVLNRLRCQVSFEKVSMLLIDKIQINILSVGDTIELYT
jgi:hypothetical protein